MNPDQVRETTVVLSSVDLAPATTLLRACLLGSAASRQLLMEQQL
jgi:hypothetical protein